MELLRSIKPCLYSLVDTLQIPPMFSEEWAQRMAPNRSLDRHCAYLFRMDPRESGWHFLEKTAITMPVQLSLPHVAWMYMVIVVIVMHYRNVEAGRKMSPASNNPGCCCFDSAGCHVAGWLHLSCSQLIASLLEGREPFASFGVCYFSCLYSWLITYLALLSLCITMSLCISSLWISLNDSQMCWLPGELMMPLWLPPGPRLGRLPCVPSRY